MFITEFISDKKETQNDFEINYFKINKTEAELISSKGNYLAIFYFTPDNKSEITHIQENKEEEKEKEEEKMPLWEEILIVVVILAGFVISYFFCCRSKKKNETNNERNVNIYNNKNFNENQTNDYNTNNRNMILNYQSDMNRILRLNYERELIRNQRERHMIMELSKKDEIIRQNKIEKEILKRKIEEYQLRQERMQKEIKQIKKQLGAEKEEIRFNKYVENLKKNYPEANDIIILSEGNKKLDELIYIVFMSGNQEINCIIICEKKSEFKNILNKVYEKYPKYKDQKSFFLTKGKAYKETDLSFEKNKIKDGDVIIMYPNEFDQMV